METLLVTVANHDGPITIAKENFDPAIHALAKDPKKPRTKGVGQKLVDEATAGATTVNADAKPETVVETPKAAGWGNAPPA